MGYDANMGFFFDKEALRNLKNQMGETVEEFALYAGCSKRQMKKLLYSKETRTITQEVLTALIKGTGITPEEIGVNLNEEVTRGRPPQPCPNCGYVRPKRAKGTNRPS